METGAEPAQGAAASQAVPTPGETQEWLAEKVEAAGYHYCQFQGKNLVCETEHYESVEVGDCKLPFTAIIEMSASRGQPFRHSSSSVLYLRGSSPDTSVSPSAFRCEKPCRSDYGDREIFFVGRPGVGGVYFPSRDLADRVAKAMNHAVALCGKEPF